MHIGGYVTTKSWYVYATSMNRDSSNADCRPGPLAGSNPAEQTEKAYYQLLVFCMHVCVYETAAVAISRSMKFM